MDNNIAVNMNIGGMSPGRKPNMNKTLGNHQQFNLNFDFIEEDPQEYNQGGVVEEGISA